MTIYSLSNNAALFKETYGDISKNHYNSDTPLLSRVKKRYDLKGKKDHIYIPLGMAGGVGGLVNGYLPEGGSENGTTLDITAKDFTARAFVERKAMKSAMTDQGAFVRFTSRPVDMAVESFDTAANILWHGDGTGKICTTKTTSAYVSGGATAPIIEMDATAFFERWFEPGFQVNIGNSGDTGVEDGLFKISSVDVTNKRVTLSRESGTFDLSSSTNANARGIYIQNTFGSVPTGIEGTVMKTTGNIYNIAYDANRWGAQIYDAQSAPASVSMMNKVFNQQLTRVPSSCLPTFGLTSPEVYAILSDLMEPNKTVMLMPRDTSLTVEAGFGFAGLAYTTPAGKVIPIVSDKHCKKDRLYFFYDEVMYSYHLPDFGWWDEDGRVFMRVPNRPWYEATYGGFWENVCHPTFQIAIKNLATT
jgi:hypothetical protein